MHFVVCKLYHKKVDLKKKSLNVILIRLLLSETKCFLNLSNTGIYWLICANI